MDVNISDYRFMKYGDKVSFIIKDQRVSMAKKYRCPECGKEFDGIDEAMNCHTGDVYEEQE